MTPERWRRITEIFQAAVARPSQERMQFLLDASADDDDLRAEVCAMLDAHDAAAAPDVPTIAISTEDLEFTPGSRVGPYEVHSLVGAGGMGCVYRGRDSRLDREVAIKVLLSRYATVPDRLRRFEQEARASGALTHPNLVTVYDVGIDGGRPYLVTELLEGETLRDRLARGPISAARACDIAAALARGLAAAHAKGVVHRDLKPENAMITRDGQVKILDFGVAKLRASSPHIDPTPHALRVQTESGVIVGTAGYMAPEQILGREADGRADIFALGAMLFELLTGRRAFDRPSRAETLEATLREDPLASIPSASRWPAGLLRIVQRCLEKDTEARFQSAADLAFALEAAAGNVIPSRGIEWRGARFSRLSVTAALLVAIGLGVVEFWPAAHVPRAADHLARFPLPLGARVRATGIPAISRDGTTIIYPATEGLVASQQLYLHRIDQIDTIKIPGTEGAARAFFSPDGRWVAFWANNKLKRTRLDGITSPVTICEVESFLGGTWSGEGTIVFASSNKGLQQVDEKGGAPRPLSTVDSARFEIDHHAPAMLPGDRAMLVTVHEGERRFRVDVLVVGTGERRTLVNDGFDARYVPTGHIVYATGTALYAAPFDLTRLERSGPPIQLLDGIATDRREGHAHYALSDTGTLVFLPLTPSAGRTLVWADRAGTTTPLPLEPRAYWTPRLSRDGRQLAVVVQDQDDAQIWIYRIDNGTFSRLTSEGRNWAPVWSPGDSHLIHASERNGKWHLIREPLDSRGSTEAIMTSEDNELAPGALSADGRTLVYVERSPSGDAKLRILDLQQRRATTIDGMPDRVFMPVLSPDGRWLGVTGGRRGQVSGWLAARPSIFVRPFGDGGPTRELMEGAGYTVWSRAGDAVYFRSRVGGAPGSPQDGVFELPFDPVRGVATGPAKELFRKAFADWWGVPGFDISQDGRFLLALLDARESMPPDPNVLLHVDDELRRLTSAGQ